MTVSPLDVLNPVFHFLDAAIQDYGLYLFIAFVYLIIPFTIWVLSGGLRRKLLRGNGIGGTLAVPVNNYFQVVCLGKAADEIKWAVRHETGQPHPAR